MEYRLTTYLKDEDPDVQNANTQSLTFPNVGQVVTYLKNDLPVGYEYSLIANLDQFDGKGRMIKNHGSFLVDHSEMDDADINSNMAINQAYQARGIQGIRDAFKSLMQ